MKTQDIRCTSCGKKLAEGLFVRLSIKCPRCRASNEFLNTQTYAQKLDEDHLFERTKNVSDKVLKWVGLI